jgi:ABC1 atypical kinase-like domain
MMNNIVRKAGDSITTSKRRVLGYGQNSIQNELSSLKNKTSLTVRESCHTISGVSRSIHHQQQLSLATPKQVIQKWRLSSPRTITTTTTSANWRTSSAGFSCQHITRIFVYRQQYRFLSCCIGLRLTDEINLLMSLLFPKFAITPIDIQCPNDDDSDDDQSKVMILSTSPMIVCDEEEQENTIVQRIIQWIQSFWKQCHNAALVTIRGSEIIIRMSPLLILTPASILAAQFICDKQSTTTSLHARVRGIADDNPNDEYAPLQLLNSKIRSPLLSSSSSQQQQQHDQHRFRTIQTNNIIADITWDYFLNSVTTLGPAFVKLCQWVATRRDIFAPNICNRLALLHDRGVCHDWSHTHTALIEAFGPNYMNDGLHIEHDPNNKYIGVIGCGSAAQVYKGTLSIPSSGISSSATTTSIPVAIKVLHPRFHHLVERDLWFINSVADLLHTIPIEYIRMLNFPRVARNFGKILLLQSDLRHEADNLKTFRINFYGNGTEDESSIFFPKPIDNWISQQILVEQLVENAVPISEYLDNNHTNSSNGTIVTTSQEIRKELAVPLLNAFLKMVFWDNFVHCGKFIFLRKKQEADTVLLLVRLFRKRLKIMNL